MKYIVWKTPYSSYGYSQGDGYFVRYKNKCADEFSPNWIDASKYKFLKGAIGRLGLTLNKSMKSMDDFLNANCSKSFLRNQNISTILGSPSNMSISFEKGHIDKIDDYGNLSSASDELFEYVENYIRQNIKRENQRITKITKNNPELLNIMNQSDEEFWNEVLNEK